MVIWDSNNTLHKYEGIDIKTRDIFKIAKPIKVLGFTNIKI